MVKRLSPPGIVKRNRGILSANGACGGLFALNCATGQGLDLTLWLNELLGGHSIAACSRSRSSSEKHYTDVPAATVNRVNRGSRLFLMHFWFGFPGFGQ